MRIRYGLAPPGRGGRRESIVTPSGRAADAHMIINNLLNIYLNIIIVYLDDFFNIKLGIHGCKFFERLGYDAKIDMDVFNSGYSEKEFMEIGTGTMDIQAITDKANALGSVDYIILEQDYSQHPELESILGYFYKERRNT